MRKKSISRYVSFVLILSICVSFFVFEVKPVLSASDIERTTENLISVNLRGDAVKVKSDEFEKVGLSELDDMDFISETAAVNMRIPKFGITVDGQASPAAGSLFDASFPSELRKVLTNRIEGNRITLNITNLPQNKVYEIYIYTAEFDRANKHAFDISVQGTKRDSVDASTQNYLWERKGPYLVHCTNKNKDVSILLESTRNHASISAIEINTVQYSSDFQDVKPSNGYYMPIMELASLGIIMGSRFNPGDVNIRYFDPGKTITGKETAFLLFRMMDNSIKQKNGFEAPRLYDTYEKTNPMSDVAPNFWAYNYMRSFYNYFYKEIPNKEVSREEFIMAQIASKRLDYNDNGRAFVSDPYIDPSSCRLKDFDDTKLSNNYDSNNYNETSSFRYYVELALEKGLVKGTLESGIYKIYPYEKISREQAAQLFFNILNYSENNFYISNPNKKVASPRITLNKRDINVGILILKSCKDPNPDFSLYELLDRNINKPMDWELVNPFWKLTDQEAYGNSLRQTTKSVYSLTGRDMEADRNHNGQADAEDTQYRNDYFKYWEVDISELSAEVIAQKYDLLFQTSHDTVDFSKDREKVLDLLGSGGQMWWENCVGLNAINSFADINLQFPAYNASAGRFSYDPLVNGKQYSQIAATDNNGVKHPLIDSLFRINENNNSAARTNSPGKFGITSELSMLGDVDEYNNGTKRIKYNGTDNSFPSNIEPVVYVSKDGADTGKVGPSVVCQLYDNTNAPDGRLVISTNDIGCGLTKNLDRKGFKAVEDYKFCYNLINWMGKVSIDFGDTSRETWDSDEKPVITTTITNFGGKTQQYVVEPIAKGNWVLEPTDKYKKLQIIDPNDPDKIQFQPGYEWILHLDDNGYPDKILLEPNESINIDYQMKIDYSLSSADASNKLDVRVYEDFVGSYDNARDKDIGTYNMINYKLSALDVNAKVNYYTDVSGSTGKSYTLEEQTPGIHGYVDLKIKSPVGGDIPLDTSSAYDYLIRVQVYEGELDGKKTLASLSDVFGSHIGYDVLSKNEKLPHSNIMYTLAELNGFNDEYILENIKGPNAPLIEPVSGQKRVEFFYNPNYNDRETKKIYKNLLIKVNGLKFTSASQYLTVRLPLERLPKDSDYSVVASYTVNNAGGGLGGNDEVGSSKEIGKCQIKHSNTFVPKISAKVLSKKIIGTSKYAKVQINYTIPRYSDENFDDASGISNYVSIYLPKKDIGMTMKKALALDSKTLIPLIQGFDETGKDIMFDTEKEGKDIGNSVVGSSRNLVKTNTPIILEEGTNKTNSEIKGYFYAWLPIRDDYVATLVTNSACLDEQQATSCIIYCAPDVQ